MRTAPHQNQIALAGNPARKSRSVERDAARVAMIRAGIGHSELASRLGIAPGTLSNWLAKDFPGDSPRWRFEAALGYGVPIWTRARDLRLRQQCATALGFDPFLVSRPDLKTRARALGLTVRRDDSLDHLRGLILKHLAANPQQFSVSTNPATTA
jgi:transcriptional regulator with XRE-family HTH domain